jgi:hypothetical protein
MSEEEMVRVANAIPKKERQKIYEVFMSNSNYFAEHDQNHSKLMWELFDNYNNYFVSLEKFSQDDINCEDCQNTIIKFWSYILFEIWQRKII